MFKRKKDKKINIDLKELQALDDVCYLSTPDIKEEYFHLNGFVCTVIQIKRLPKVIGKRILDVFKGYPDIVITFDMQHLDNRTMIDFLDTKMDNMENESTILSKSKDRRNLRNKMTDEKQFVNYVDHNYENGKYITMRIYLKAENLDKLKDLTEHVYYILKEREFFGAIQRNLIDKELRDFTALHNPVKDIVTTKGITNMIMSDNAYEVKPMMFPLGETMSGLPYCPDYINYAYRSYCITVLSKQGGGKSSLIKEMAQGALMRKEQVIMLDVHNQEYAPLAERYHVPSVVLDMRNGINPFQIFNNDDKAGVITDMTISDVVNLNKAMFMSVVDEADTTVVSMYVNVLTKLYEKYKNRDVDVISNKEWFKGSDIFEYVYSQCEDGIYKDMMFDTAYKLLEHLKVMIYTYGYFFNTYTTMDIDITKSIHFDLSCLNIEGGGQLENAYFSLIFSFLGKIMRKNEKLNEELEKGKTVTRPLHPITVVVEETGTILKKYETAKMFDVFMRQTRKARVSFIYAIHTINDIMGGEEAYQSLIKSIFGLCTVYIIGQIDLQTAVGLPTFINGITELDAQSAANFGVKENDKRRKFLAYTVDDNKKIVFYSKILPRQKQLFGGGK